MSSLPHGAEFYAACLRFHTSTELTAEQIHQLGLDEVDRIEAEMKKASLTFVRYAWSALSFFKLQRQDKSCIPLL